MLYKCNVIEFKKILVDKGVGTISALSEKACASRNTLGQILAGKEQPSAIIIRKISEALELEPETIGKIFFDKDLRDK